VDLILLIVGKADILSHMHDSCYLLIIPPTKILNNMCPVCNILRKTDV